MAFNLFGTKYTPTVDPALEQQLKSKGMTSKLEELKSPITPPTNQSSRLDILGNPLSSQTSTLPYSLPKTNKPVTPPTIQTPTTTTTTVKTPTSPTVKLASVEGTKPSTTDMTGLGTDDKPLGQAPTGMYIDDQGRLQMGTKPTTTNQATATGTTIDEIMKKYGVQTTETPTLPTADDYLKEYGLDAKSLESAFEQQKAAISQKYNLEREQAKVRAENRKQSTLSNLYAAGEVNPLSSSFRNVEAQVQNEYEADIKNIDQMEAAEMADAINASLGFKSDAASKYRTKYIDEQSRIEKENELERTNIQSNLKNFQDAITLVRSDKALTTDEEDRTRKSIMDTLTTYGGSFFDGIKEDELTALSKAAGYSTNQLTNAIKSMKKNELLGRANVKEIDGSLYNITTDDKGNIKTELLIKGTPKTSSESGLTPAQINSTVNSIASAFDNEPIVKEYNVIKANYDMLAGAKTSPTDDISRVYVFAKVMDPNSVVREGEYKTIQDYSQALLKSAGINIKRVFESTGFLTDEARKAMQDTIKRRLDVSKVQYDQVANEYQRQINDAYAGKNRTITDYTGSTPTSDTTGGEFGW